MSNSVKQKSRVYNREQVKEDLRKIKKGEIYYVQKRMEHSQHPTASPMLIISVEDINKTTQCINAVPVSLVETKILPTHKKISNKETDFKGFAICEILMRIPISNVGAYITTVDNETMKDIDGIIAIMLGLHDEDAGKFLSKFCDNYNIKSEYKDKENNDISGGKKDDIELEVLKMERDMYKKKYMELRLEKQIL